jgi:hypothetical protein
LLFYLLGFGVLPACRQAGIWDFDIGISPGGAVAQLGEHPDGIGKVTGSTPVSSTIKAA